MGQKENSVKKAWHSEPGRPGFKSQFCHLPAWKNYKVFEIQFAHPKAGAVIPSSQIVRIN